MNDEGYRFSEINVSDHWVDPLGWGDWDRIGRHRPEARRP